jgi:hypothetical protein
MKVTAWSAHDLHQNPNLLLTIVSFQNREQKVDSKRQQRDFILLNVVCILYLESNLLMKWRWETSIPRLLCLPP